MTNYNPKSIPAQDRMPGRALLNRTECSALRGIAILGIFLHNYLHWLKPMAKENEYQFHQANVDGMMERIMSPSWDILLQFFSFFGHYGVPVFLFLSGYGLVLKYENAGPTASGGDTVRDVSQFIRQHFMKLFPMMALGFTVFAMVDWITPMRHHWSWSDIIGQLTMTINLFPKPDSVIWPGPYWFFGLMMQLYLLYRVVLYRRGNKVLLTLILLCWAMQAMCFDAPEGEALNRIRYNFIGGMLPFGMGILLARMPSLPRPTASANLSVLILSLFAVLTLSLGFHAWLWVPAFVVSLHVALIKILPSFCIKAFDWLGVLSAAIFVCHPITRKIFIPISRSGDIMDGLVLYVVTTLVLAMLFRMAIQKMRNQ